MPKDGPHADNRHRIGLYGERLALQAYEKAGYALLVHRYRSRQGEIDLILQKGKTICFVEVRTRTTTTFGTAEQSITPHKIRTIRRVSRQFLSEHNLHDAPIQFDVITIHIDKTAKQARITRIPHAF